MRPERPKSPLTANGNIAKRDDDQQLVFGWASVVSKDGQPVTDLQGDIISEEELEKSAYDYVLNSRDGGLQHKVRGVSTLVESIVVTPDKMEALGVPADVAKALPVGWWVGFKVHDAEVWSGVKKGLFTEFSIHGRGLRKAID